MSAARRGAEGTPSSLRVDAPAKVNLYLHVLGRRADGLHRLDSLVAFAGVGDTVGVTASSGLTLAVDGPFARAVPPGRDNLVLRAAALLAETAAAGGDGRNARRGAAITLTKRLPVAAGLGGGSADAAAALRALSRLWHLRPDAARQLRGIAPALGADVPVCLAARPAFVGGIGERLDPAPPLPPAHLVLVNPGVPVPTAAVFHGHAAPASAPARFAEAPADAVALAGLLAERRNDLTAAARRLAPTLDAVLASLDTAPGCLLARMSGSGATAFGLFAAAAPATAVARAIAAAEPGWWVAAAPLLADAADIANRSDAADV